MKVKDLIEKLKELGEDKEIILEQDNGASSDNINVYEEDKHIIIK